MDPRPPLLEFLFKSTMQGPILAELRHALEKLVSLICIADWLSVDRRA
jgi:hypothetical protein